MSQPIFFGYRTALELCRTPGFPAAAQSNASFRSIPGRAPAKGELREALDCLCALLPAFASERPLDCLVGSRSHPHDPGPFQFHACLHRRRTPSYGSTISSTSPRLLMRSSRNPHGRASLSCTKWNTRSAVRTPACRSAGKRATTSRRSQRQHPYGSTLSATRKSEERIAHAKPSDTLRMDQPPRGRRRWCSASACRPSKAVKGSAFR